MEKPKQEVTKYFLMYVSIILSLLINECLKQTPQPVEGLMDGPGEHG